MTYRADLYPSSRNNSKPKRKERTSWRSIYHSRAPMVNAAPIATRSSKIAAGTGPSDAAVRVRTASPPYAPVSAPAAPSTTPSAGPSPRELATIHPQPAPLSSRAARAPGEVRGGAFGCRSPAYSNSAAAPSANANPLGFLTNQSAAGGVNVRSPATTPRRNAEPIATVPTCEGCVPS